VRVEKSTVMKFFVRISYWFKGHGLAFCGITMIALIILQSRERLLRSLRAMNAGDAADQVIRQVDKMIKNGDRSTRDARISKVCSDLLSFSAM